MDFMTFTILSMGTRRYMLFIKKATIKDTDTKIGNYFYILSDKGTYYLCIKNPLLQMLFQQEKKKIVKLKILYNLIYIQYHSGIIYILIMLW